MLIGFFQFSPQFAHPEINRSYMAQAIKNVDAQLVVFPELCTSGYFFSKPEEVKKVAEPVPGPTTEIFQAQTGKTGCYFVIGLPELTDEGIYNSAVLVGPEGVAGLYRKVHLFNEEKKYFKPGNLGFPVFEINGVRVGLLVCFDHFFPEAARTLALQGAQIVCHPSNLVLPEYGQLTTRVRSIENRIFWILANRFGEESSGGKTLRYTGASQITGPDGAILASGPAQDDALITVDINPDMADNKQVTPLNHVFKDRRIEMYKG